MPKKKKGKASHFTDKTREAYEFKVFPPGTVALKDVKLDSEVTDHDAYEEELESLQKKLFEKQIKLFLQQKRAMFVFEGWDAAGKGGAIKRLTALMDPRGYKVWPIAAPRDAEKRHHYLWRFWQRLPEAGELAVFDRSWYGRVLVERVEGFCREAEWQRAYDEINAFERMLTDDGVVMRKFFIHIDKDTQLKRFKERQKDPIKNYKIGDDDWRNRAKWKQYESAIQDMFDRTHRPDAPWIAVPGDDKRFARLAVLREANKALKDLVKE
ncbi:MAG: polyphosphate kinase 2 family protein [Myxococcaceae bacterium]